MPENIGIDQLNLLIKNANAGWQAGTTTVSELPPDQQKSHLGYVPAAGEESLEQRTQASLAKLGTIPVSVGAAPALTEGPRELAQGIAPDCRQENSSSTSST